MLAKSAVELFKLGFKSLNLTNEPQSNGLSR
jgi:hypothetical protein